jgi:hypothetical protein
MNNKRKQSKSSLLTKDNRKQSKSSLLTKDNRINRMITSPIFINNILRQEPVLGFMKRKIYTSSIIKKTSIRKNKLLRIRRKSSSNQTNTLYLLSQY